MINLEPKPKSPNAPFKVGDRVEHISLGGGCVREISKTGGGNWSVYVEFDEYQERFGGRYASIVAEYKGNVFLTKGEDPYTDVEFGTNVLDLDDAVSN